MQQCIDFVGDQAAVKKFFLSGEKGVLKGAHARPYAARAEIIEGDHAVVIMVDIADDAHIEPGKRIFRQVVSSFARIK